MGRRRMLLWMVALALLALVGLALFVWFATPEAGVTRANYERIQEGMTRQEVERLLAGPPVNAGPEDADYSDEWDFDTAFQLYKACRKDRPWSIQLSPTTFSFNGRALYPCPEGEIIHLVDNGPRVNFWMKDGTAIGVMFNNEGTVDWKGFIAGEEKTVWVKLRGLLGW